MNGPSWLSKALAVAVAVGCLSGCGAPDRRADAQHLQDTMSAMPGVSSANVGYHNDEDRGARINIYAFVPDATRDQIRDLVVRINTVRDDRFAGYTQDAMFAVSPDRRVLLSRMSELDPDQIADDAIRLRQVGSTVNAEQVAWFRNRSTSVLNLRGAGSPTALVLLALVAAVGSTSVKVGVEQSAPPWGADFPFTADDQRRLENRVGWLPVAVRAVGTTGAQVIVGVDVRVFGPERAEADLDNTVSALGKQADIPMVVTWTVDRTAGWRGSVSVNGCSSDDHAAGTPEAADLQSAVRVRFERCKPRP